MIPQIAVPTSSIWRRKAYTADAEQARKVSYLTLLPQVRRTNEDYRAARRCRRSNLNGSVTGTSRPRRIGGVASLMLCFRLISISLIIRVTALVLLALLLIYFVVPASSAGAQQPPPPARDAPEVSSRDVPTTFKVHSNVVLVRVVVRDSDGKVIRNLKREDFQLEDNHKVQIISSFSVETPARMCPR